MRNRAIVSRQGHLGGRPDALQQVLAGGRVERLHDEDLRAAHIFGELEVELAIGEATRGARAQRE